MHESPPMLRAARGGSPIGARAKGCSGAATTRSLLRPAEAGGGNLVLGALNEAGGSTRLYTPSFSNYNQNVFLNGSSGSVVGSNQKADGVGVAGFASGQNGTAMTATTDGDSSTIGLRATSDPEASRLTPTP